MKPSRLLRTGVACLTLALACVIRAEETRETVQPAPLDLEATEIRGNQELPKVLYIVPWKDPAMAELAGRPVNSLVEEVLAPVDRDVFRRQSRYFGQLYGPAGQAAGPGAGGDPSAGSMGKGTTN